MPLFDDSIKTVCDAANKTKPVDFSLARAMGYAVLDDINRRFNGEVFVAHQDFPFTGSTTQHTVSVPDGLARIKFFGEWDSTNDRYIVVWKERTHEWFLSRVQGLAAQFDARGSGVAREYFEVEPAGESSDTRRVRIHPATNEALTGHMIYYSRINQKNCDLLNDRGILVDGMKARLPLWFPQPDNRNDNQISYERALAGMKAYTLTVNPAMHVGQNPYNQRRNIGLRDAL